MEHVKDNIFAELISPGCNIGIIPTRKGTVIVDTPLLDWQAKAIGSELSAGNHDPVRFIIISHPHGDHILGTDLFGEDVLIIGNRKAREKMDKHSSAWVLEWVETWNWEDQKEVEEMATAQITLPQVIFQDELTLNFGGVEMWILPLPGHLAECVGVFVPEANVLITGDALFCGHHPYMGVANFKVWFESFKKMRELKADHIVPGHGPVCGIEAIDKQQKYMEKMIEIRSKWNPEEGNEAIPEGPLNELIAFYPLYDRPESVMKTRIIESIRVAGDPKF